MVKVNFIDVGGFNMRWQAELKELSYDCLYSEIKEKGALGSRDIDFRYDDETKQGDILVSVFRKVGTFEVIEK